MLFLIVPLLVNSQTLLTDSTCCVPCSTLRKALIVKADRDFLKNQLDVSRDSTKLLINIVNSQDSIIKTQNSSISMYSLIESSYTKLVSNKDEEIELFKGEVTKQKRHKHIAIGVGITFMFLSILIAL